MGREPKAQPLVLDPLQSKRVKNWIPLKRISFSQKTGSTFAGYAPVGVSEVPIKINEPTGEHFLCVHVWGKLVKADYERLFHQFAELPQRPGKRRMLFDMIGFEGWNAGALWEEIKFDLQHAQLRARRDRRRQQMGTCHGDFDQTVHKGEDPIFRRHPICRCSRMVGRIIPDPFMPLQVKRRKFKADRCEDKET